MGSQGVVIVIFEQVFLFVNFYKCLFVNFYPIRTHGNV